MIYELSRDIDAKLLARKFPVRVVYGPERTQRETFTPVIVVERARGQSDTFGAPKGQQVNARKIATRGLGAVATIYAASSLPGARVEDHERECEKLVDALLVALYEWGVEARTGGIPVTEGRYLTAEEFGGREVWAGVVYVLRFRVPRGVYALSYTGEAKPEQALGGFQNRTEARLAGAPNEPPEIGCGEIT